jgi:hypothetical protein
MPYLSLCTLHPTYAVVVCAGTSSVCAPNALRCKCPLGIWHIKCKGKLCILAFQSRKAHSKQCAFGGAPATLRVGCHPPSVWQLYTPPPKKARVNFAHKCALAFCVLACYPLRSVPLVTPLLHGSAPARGGSRSLLTAFVCSLVGVRQAPPRAYNGAPLGAKYGVTKSGCVKDTWACAILCHKPFAHFVCLLRCQGLRKCVAPLTR